MKKFMSNCIFICSYFILQNSANAQSIFIVTETNTIYNLNLSDLSVTENYTVPINEVGYILDIAMTPNGTLYGIASSSILEIDLSLNSYTIISDLPTAGSFPGLVANGQNQLVFGGFLSLSLYNYDITNNETQLIAEGISTPGDFTFYKGNLLFPSNINLGIKAFDSSAIINVGCTSSQIFSFFNVFSNCSFNQIYGIDEQNNIFSYSIEADSFELLGSINLGETIYGACTDTEYMASDCQQENLGIVECSLSTKDYSFSDIKVFSNTSEKVIEIIIPSRLESNNIELYDLTGRRIKTLNNNSSKYSTSDLSMGLYILKISFRNSNKTYKKKILI